MPFGCSLDGGDRGKNNLSSVCYALTHYCKFGIFRENFILQKALKDIFSTVKNHD